MEMNPPKSYQALLENFIKKDFHQIVVLEEEKEDKMMMKMKPKDEQLPLIDLSQLSHGNVFEKEKCKREIIQASKEWGFFQVINHGISNEILSKMVNEQMKLFRKPFDDKKGNEKLSKSYRWGTPSPMSLFSWSEAFHIPLAELSRSTHGDFTNNNLRSTMEEFTKTVSDLAQKIAKILEENVGNNGGYSGYFEENCLEETCYVRLNRYPPCPVSSDKVFGLMPHTDSDFLTILYQDQVGGLQLVKDGRWITVLPNPQALIINIGDLFQAWSNGLYRSVEHRVMTNKKVERFSVAYFLCPSYNTIIQSRGNYPLYKKFSFGEFRQQVQEDVRKFGYKVGLSRFLLSTT